MVGVTLLLLACPYRIRVARSWLVFGLTEKPGSMARIGPNLLITTDHRLIRRMNAPRSQYTRSEWYQALRFHPSRDNIASYRDEQKHTRLRGQMALGV